MFDQQNDNNNQKLRAIKQARKVFIWLLVGGLSIGVVVSIGVVKLMDRLGLTSDRNQIEIIQEKIKENE